MAQGSLVDLTQTVSEARFIFISVDSDTLRRHRNKWGPPLLLYKGKIHSLASTPMQPLSAQHYNEDSSDSTSDEDSGDEVKVSQFPPYTRSTPSTHSP